MAGTSSVTVCKTMLRSTTAYPWMSQFELGRELTDGFTEDLEVSNDRVLPHRLCTKRFLSGRGVCLYACYRIEDVP